jgi:hypothetical protein
MPGRNDLTQRLRHMDDGHRVEALRAVRRRSLLQAEHLLATFLQGVFDI